MEKTTAFNLDHAIQNWRQRLSQSPSYRADNVEELESHLRDSVATLAGKGLSEDEAFVIALHRVGKPQPLESEFAKVNGQEVWLNRLLWMLIGIQAYGLISALAGAFSRTGSSLLIVSLVRPGSLFSGADPTSFGSLSSILLSALIVVTDLVALAAVTVAGWWLLRGDKGWATRWACRRGGLVVGAVVFCAAMALFGALGPLGNAWLARSEGPATFAKVAVSFTMASLILYPLKMIALAVLTVWLARRQLQQSPG